MNRRLLFQVTLPAVVIGTVLLGACLVNAWYISRLQNNLANILSENVASLKAAQELEIRVRQLRFHSFVYLLDPLPARLEPIEKDHERFEEALRLAQTSANNPEERAYLETIQTGYQRYHDEMAELRQTVSPGKPRTDAGALADAHPIRPVVDQCQELFRVNEEAMGRTAEESAQVGRQARMAMLLLGVAGPVGGLIIGYGMARGLSRSIYQLSVRVQDVAQRLGPEAEDVASVSVAADGDLRNLDKQIGHVVRRVEEVAERLQRQQRDLLRAEQLSAVGQLAASVAHEVRNPLAAVKMLVEAALRPRNRKPLTEDDLRVIHGEVGRLEQTVQSFLDFARLPTPRRSACDLRAVLAQAVELVQARANQQEVKITVRSPEEPVTADVDRSQLCTVLVNLFLNSLDAMPHGGTVDVTLEASPAAGLGLVVADTGGGIPAEMLDRLFTPFASTKPTGTGLGLSLSRRIVEEHGGRLTGANRPEGGACFTLTLPADQGPIPEANGRRERTAP